MSQGESSGEPLTNETYIYICKQVGLTSGDLLWMDVGDVLDYIETFIEEKQQAHNGSKAAAQSDFDSF